MSCERTPANRVPKENRKEYNLYFEGVKTNKDAMISETDFFNMFDRTLDEYDELVHQYTEEELDEAA